MAEVNRLMEEAQDDLEPILFRLVGHRDLMRDTLRQVVGKCDCDGSCFVCKSFRILNGKP